MMTPDNKIQHIFFHHCDFFCSHPITKLSPAWKTCTIAFFSIFCQASAKNFWITQIIGGVSILRKILNPPCIPYIPIRYISLHGIDIHIGIHIYCVYICIYLSDRQTHVYIYIWYMYIYIYHVYGIYPRYNCLTEKTCQLSVSTDICLTRKNNFSKSSV